MADVPEWPAEQPRRSKRDRIERLRKRLERACEQPAGLVIVLKGILDLLADEL